ncbi:MAG: hypothetical protein V3V74_07665 [Nitrosomonadaceae bacterium]
MMDEKFRKCTFNIFWSEEDQEWVGTCDQFKGLSYLDKSIHDAASGIFTLVESVIEDMTANGEPMPWTV